MDTQKTNLSNLFLQLGLDNSDEAITNFIKTHQGLNPSTELKDATFWTPSQSSFINEAISLDSNWCEVVDELDCRLR